MQTMFAVPPPISSYVTETDNPNINIICACNRATQIANMYIDTFLLNRHRHCNYDITLLGVYTAYWYKIHEADI